MNDPKIQDPARPSESDAPKQKYEQPAITYRAPLEATAGECSSTKSTIPCSAPLMS